MGLSRVVIVTIFSWLFSMLFVGEVVAATALGQEMRLNKPP